MKFRGKINSLDIDYNIPLVDMSVTVGNQNFDVSFEVLWGDADEFDGWEQLEKIVDQNRYDREGAVMADINAGRRELSVKYDGGEAYAYGDEAQVDVEIENIPGDKRKDMKYINEEGQFDFKKFVADGALEKNLNEAKDIEEGIHDMDITAADHTRAGKRKDMSPQEETLRGYAAQARLRPLLRKFEGLKYEDIIKMAEIDNLTTKEIFDVDYMEDRIRTHLEIREVKEQGQFDFKKFVADGALEKNLNESNGPLTYVDYPEDLGGLFDPTPTGPDEDEAIDAIKALIAKGTPRDEAIKIIADKVGFKYRYLDSVIDEVKKEEIEEQGPRPKRKHRNNPARFGRGSHGKIPNFDDAIDAADPSYPYGVDDPEATSAKASKARKAARDMGLEPELDKAEYEMHFGRGGGGDKRYGERDPFRWKNPNKRVTKAGKLHKQDLKTAKQSSKDSLDILRKNKAYKKSQGDYLPEFTLKEIDEMLKEARSKDNK